MPATADNYGESVTASPASRDNEAERRNSREKPGRTAKHVSGTADTLTSYLQRISRMPLLSAVEEAALARRVQKGDDQAREQMISANLRLVVRIATAYQGHGLPLLDLISEGNIGLMNAVARFDPNRGARLCTYAGIWIKQAIRRAIANYGREIRLPVHVVADVIRMRQIASRMEEALGREPDDTELAREMDLPTARVMRMRQAASRPTSLDAPLEENEEEGDSLRDLLSDERSRWTPAHEFERQGLLATVTTALKCLEPREQLVLHHRFGLKGGHEHTLEAIGKKLGLTRERIRQIEQTALKKLRKRLIGQDGSEGIVPHLL